MLSPTYEITTALSHTDELISPPYDIAIVTISYGRVTMSSVWDSMMSKKNMGWPFYAAVAPHCCTVVKHKIINRIRYKCFLWRIDGRTKQLFCRRYMQINLHDRQIVSNSNFTERFLVFQSKISQHCLNNSWVSNNRHALPELIMTQFTDTCLTRVHWTEFPQN